MTKLWSSQKVVERVIWGRFSFALTLYLFVWSIWDLFLGSTSAEARFQFGHEAKSFRYMDGGVHNSRQLEGCAKYSINFNYIDCKALFRGGNINLVSGLRRQPIAEVEWRERATEYWRRCYQGTWKSGAQWRRGLSWIQLQRGHAWVSNILVTQRTTVVWHCDEIFFLCAPGARVEAHASVCFAVADSSSECPTMRESSSRLIVVCIVSLKVQLRSFVQSSIRLTSDLSL